MMNDTSEYKCIYFLAVLYMSFMTCSAVLGNKLIQTPLGVMSAASLVSPFWYILGDVITEVYGLRMIMRLFWSVIICQFILAAACFLLIRLPSPDFWQNQASYELVVGHLLRIALFQFAGVVIAWNINARLLLKWKQLLKGRYFWLRSLGSSGIGLCIFSVISVFPTLYGTLPLDIVISTVTWSCALKILFLLLLAVPSTLCVALIRQLENIDQNNQGLKINPFLKQMTSL